MTTNLLDLVRQSGKCPPSLLSDDRHDNSDNFDEAVQKTVAAEGFFLASNLQVAEDFKVVLERVESIEKIPANGDESSRKATLEQRRAIVLAIAGATPSESPSLNKILADGYLNVVKNWLEDVLSGSLGGIDFLLHLLSSIVELPVTKSVVKESGMGKTIGAVEKHRICKGSPNESVIKERVQKIKDVWNASVKSRKTDDGSMNAHKRPLDKEIEQQTTKRVKASEDSKRGTSFSSLLKKVSRASSDKSSPSTATVVAISSDAESTKGTISNGSSKIASEVKSDKDEKKVGVSTKSSMRVKWADHFGGNLSISDIVDDGEQLGKNSFDPSISWSDRKKRDRLREKELLLKVKKAKLIDDDEEEDVGASSSIQATIPWNQPIILPPIPGVTATTPSSDEVRIQNERLVSVAQIRYQSEYEVPASPTPLSDIEQALDMTSQSSAVVASIPFFVPTSSAPVPSSSVASNYQSTSSQSAMYAVAAHVNTATPEFVQSLGLPMFLVGQDCQALETLARSPALLATLVDANGMYDQTRLLNLVHSLSSTQVPVASQPSSFTGSSVPSYMPAPGPYGSSTAVSFGQPSGVKNGMRSSEGNLHVSNYGPSTTEFDLIALFTPYVKVDEVVMKGSFAFVNTSDPANAQIAREALEGMLLDGMPIRINPATRRAKDNTSSYGAAVPSNTVGTLVSAVMPSSHISGSNALPTTVPTGVNVDAARDDRGNPATKNLFVAGYGAGTTEQQLRDAFGQFAQVVGVVNKGAFSFVNTSDRGAAVRAREMLNGTMLNGGALRINFAKETGRLGTSFDLTYNAASGRALPGSLAPSNSLSYYGRG